MHSLSRKFFIISLLVQCSIQGRGPEARPLFLDQNFFWETAPPFPYLSVWMTGGPPLSQGPAPQCIIVFHLNELLFVVTRLVYCPYVRNFRYSL